MSNYVNSLIEYNIKEESNCNLNDINTFKQLSYEYEFQIPECKSDANVIEKVISNVEVKSTHIIATPKGISIDGQNLTGCKAITVGTIQVFVEYESCDDSSGIQIVSYLIPFSVPVVVPEFYSNYSNILSNVDIEYINAELIDPRNIYISLAMLVTVEV